MHKKYIITAALAVFLVGGAYIVYSGRPVVQMERASDAAEQEADKIADAVAPVADESGSAPSVAVGEPNPSAPAPVPTETVPAPKEEKPAPAPSEGKTYTMEDVQAHASAEACWSTINGGVYDLTSWIARHPGGPDKIMGLCGTDGSERFNRKHGSFVKAQDMLILLKIGTLN